MKKIHVALLFGSVACLLGAASPNSKRENKSVSILNQKVPPISVRTIAGQAIDSTYFKGKVTLISFMFIGCPPCMKEAPALNEIYQEVSSDSLQMLCIAPHTADQMISYNSEEQNRFSQIRKNSNVTPIPYPIIAECMAIKAGRDPRAIGPECGVLSSKFSVSGYPVTLLVDRQGVVRKVYDGFSNDPSYVVRFKQRLKIAIREVAAQTK